MFEITGLKPFLPHSFVAPPELVSWVNKVRKLDTCQPRLPARRVGRGANYDDLWVTKRLEAYSTLCQNFLDDAAVDIGQPIIATGVMEGQLLVIDSQ